MRLGRGQGGAVAITVSVRLTHRTSILPTTSVYSSIPPPRQPARQLAAQTPKGSVPATAPPATTGTPPLSRASRAPPTRPPPLCQALPPLAWCLTAVTWRVSLAVQDCRLLRGPEGLVGKMPWRVQRGLRLLLALPCACARRTSTASVAKLLARHAPRTLSPPEAQLHARARRTTTAAVAKFLARRAP